MDPAFHDLSAQLAAGRIKTRSALAYRNLLGSSQEMQHLPRSPGWHTRFVPAVKALALLSVCYLVWNVSTTSQLIRSEDLTVSQQQSAAMLRDEVAPVPIAQRIEPTSDLSSGSGSGSQTIETLNDVPKQASSESSGSDVAAAQTVELPSDMSSGEASDAGSVVLAASSSSISDVLSTELSSDSDSSSHKGENSSNAASNLRDNEKTELPSELSSETPTEMPSELPSDLPSEVPSAFPTDDILASQSTPNPYWFQSEAYRDESGCDFSAIVDRFKPDELEINCDNIDMLETGEFIGSGLWRKAYKATWNGRDVVVKRVRDYMLSQSDVLYRHVKEAAAIFPIRNDPNIVGLVGWCNLTIALEYIPTNLDMLLHDTSDPISVRRALEMARDAARSLVQVHNVPGGPIAHGDIKCDQFLIGDDDVLRLNDFNYAMYAGPRRVNSTATSEKCTFHLPYTGKSRWHSPEEMKQLPLDEKIDIYGLSLVMWAMKSRRRPYLMNPMDEAWEGIPKGLRPPVEFMSDYPQAMQNLIIRGWDDDPKKRPTAMEMADEVDRILQAYTEE